VDSRRARPLLVIVLGLLLIPALVLSQESGEVPLLFVNGIPDAKTEPPNVHTYVSVIDKETGRAIEGLNSSDFAVEEAASLLPDVTVSYEPVGLAAAIVVDRGGISKRGDGRVKEVVDLSRVFLDRLVVEGQPNDDMIAIVGVSDDATRQLYPMENFSHNPVDKNLVGNALTIMEGEAVNGGTPLYEGLDAAIELLIRNADGNIRKEIKNRRQFIIVFSDGVDQDFSDEAREQDIIRKAVDNAILIYTVGVAPRAGSFRGADTLSRLAAQTDGLYTLYTQGDDEARQQVVDLFDRILTQRFQYRLIYVTHQPKGDYQLHITVQTEGGSAEANRGFSSLLELPQLVLSVSPDTRAFSLPYSEALDGPEPLSLTLHATTEFVDGVERAPTAVRYYANGDQIGESAVSPDFALEWDVGRLHISGSVPITETYTLTADAVDPYLARSYTVADPQKIQVTWGARPPEPVVEEDVEKEAPQEDIRDNRWLFLVLLALLFALVVLVLSLIRTRGALANKVVKGATGFLKDVTRPLSTAPRRAPGKLVIQRGANVGREYALSEQVTKVGRDAQFADFALQDEYISNPHFSIHREGTQFYIMDEGSTNGTLLNGMVLQPRQRVPLAPDAIIELGQTRLQFKQLGMATQSLDVVSGSRGGQPAPTRPPVASPPAAPPNPYTTGALDEPPAEHKPPSNPYMTQKVQDE
jgi:hypothetical protein